MKFTYLLGAVLSSATPYLFMISCGYFFGRVKLITKEGLNSFAKMVIEIFLPVYLFIHVARSTFTLNFELYGSFIVSFLFYLVIAGALSFMWAFLSKMDLRYRFTFICMTSFVDVRRLHYLYINSFCSLLTIKSLEEKNYCSNLNITSEVHTFFQGILIWYLGFNLIRVDKAYTRYSDQLWDKIHKEENKTEENMIELKEQKELQNYFNLTVDLVDKNPLSGEEKKKIKDIYNQYTVANEKDESKQDKETINNNNIINSPDNNNINSTPINIINSTSQNTNNPHQMIHVVGSRSFYHKIGQFSKARFFKNDDIWKEVLYILSRPPIIALFIGFVVGFIRPIRIWLFETTTPMFLFFDTFNNIANCNILIGFLVIGTNLYLDDYDDYNKMNVIIKIRIIDYIVHLVLKVIIMPFFGIVFTYVVYKYFAPDNKVLAWTCYIQWVMPTSHDIMQIIQLKNINVKFVAICLSIQWLAQCCINDLIHLPAVMSVLGILEGGG